MCDIKFSPAAVIFWPRHAFVDDVAYCWQCQCNPGPECDTITLPPPPSGDCIEQLGRIIAEVPRHYGHQNRSLLVTFERAVADLRAGDAASAERTLSVLLHEATALTLNGHYTRYLYEAVAMQTRVCLEDLRTRE